MGNGAVGKKLKTIGKVLAYIAGACAIIAWFLWFGYRADRIREENDYLQCAGVYRTPECFIDKAEREAKPYLQEKARREANVNNRQQ